MIYRIEAITTSLVRNSLRKISKLRVRFCRMPFQMSFALFEADVYIFAGSLIHFAFNFELL